MFVDGGDDRETTVAKIIVRLMFGMESSLHIRLGRGFSWAGHVTYTWGEQWVDKVAAEKQRLRDGGATFITFSPEDAAWWTKSAFNTEWEVYMEKYPELSAKFKELLTP